MVDFTLTEEQESLRELAHDFAENEIRPVAWEYDASAAWPLEVFKKAHEVGLMNTHVPEAYGGPGLSYLEGCLIEEELAWGCSGIATSIGANGLAGAPILVGGSEETKKKYMGMLTESPKLATETDDGALPTARSVGAARVPSPLYSRSPSPPPWGHTYLIRNGAMAM